METEFIISDHEDFSAACAYLRRLDFKPKTSGVSQPPIYFEHEDGRKARCYANQTGLKFNPGVKAAIDVLPRTADEHEGISK